MARRSNQQRKTTNLETKKSTNVEPKVSVSAAEKVTDERPSDVKVVMVSTHALVHPCGTVCRPNDPVTVPDDGWTNAQVAAGLLAKLG